ncbi:MAG: GNAT family N-acetyltransferase [Bacteroidota bacterium]
MSPSLFTYTYMDYHITTARLGLRTWQPADLDPFAALNADPEVMRYFPKSLDRETTQKFIDKIMAHHQAHGYGWYAVDELSSGSFMGFIGLAYNDMDVDFTPCVEIGWRLAKNFWRKGYATEGARACLDFAFESLGMSEVYSFTALQNLPSQGVMKKIGMYRVGEFDHPKLTKGHALERHVLYLKKSTD